MIIEQGVMSSGSCFVFTVLIFCIYLAAHLLNLPPASYYVQDEVDFQNADVPSIFLLVKL